MSKEITISVENLAQHLKKLNDLINTQLEAGREVYLIALSRKMPRVITWTLKNDEIEKDFRDTFRQTIEKCNYTSELALPFVLDKNTPKDAYILILDDIIINGDTMAKAASDVYYLTGIKSEVWCFFGYENARWPKYVSNIHISYNHPLKFEEARKTLKIFTEIICKYELPTDIEYPLIHIKLFNGKSSEEESMYADVSRSIEHAIDRYCQSKKNYEIPNGKFCKQLENHIKSRTILTNTKLDDFYGNDFSKIRIFKYEDELKIASYAPIIIKDRSLNDVGLLSNSRYKRIWGAVIDAINSTETANIDDLNTYDHKNCIAGYEYRKERLKMIWACWLISLSKAIEEIGSLLDDQQISALKIDLEDIQILAGESFGNLIIGMINELIQNRVTTESIIEFADYPETIVADNKANDYINARVNKMQQMSKDSYDRQLLEIFKAGYTVKGSKPIFEFLNLNLENSVQESMRSIITLLEISFLANTAELKAKAKMEANKWIDHYIDLGYIVPRYQRITNHNRETYWRRYFHSSHLITTIDD